MKSTLLVLIGIAVGVVATALYTKTMAAPSRKLEHLPEPYYKVLFENGDIRVVEHRMKPGESEPKHSHPSMLAYILETASIQVTEADGTVNAVTLAKGAFQELPPWTHSIKNVGTTGLHTLLIELKHASK